MRRVYTAPAFHMGMGEHFNHSLGEFVHNKTELTDGFKYKSEEMSERMGFDVNYKPVDPNDHAAIGITPEALEKRDRNTLEKGMREAKVIVA